VTGTPDNEAGTIGTFHPGITEKAALSRIQDTPRKNPIIANGIAKMVCENLIRLR